MSISTMMGPSRSMSDNPCGSVLNLLSCSLAGEREGGGAGAGKACDLEGLLEGGNALQSQSIGSGLAQQTVWDVSTNFTAEAHGQAAVN